MAACERAAGSDEHSPVKAPGGSALAAVVLFAFLGSGCAIRSGRVGPVTMGPAGPGAAKTITISVAVKDVDPRLREAALRAYQEAGVFASVTAEAVDPTIHFPDPAAERHVSVWIVDRSHHDLSDALGLEVSVWTMGVIPYHGTSQFVVMTTILDATGKVIGTFEKSETVEEWLQLFLIFVLPFQTPEHVFERVVTDLNRATIVEAQAGGIF